MNSTKSPNQLLFAILIGIIAGSLFGGIWPRGGQAIHLAGDLFIRALLALVVPLIITAMVVGVASLGDIRRLGGLGGRTVLYYLVTTAIAVTIGIVLVNVIRPGRADTEEQRVRLRGGILLSEAAYHIEGSILIVESSAIVRRYDSRYRVVLLDQGRIRGGLAENQENTPGRFDLEKWTDPEGRSVTPRLEGIGVQIDLGVAERVRGKSRSIAAVIREMLEGLVPRNLFQAMAENDVLPLILFSLIFGAVLTTLGEVGKPVIRVFEGLNAAIMRLIHLLMIVSPIGIGALIAGRLGNAGGFSGFWPELLRLGKYALTVASGLLIHALIVLPLFLALFGKRNPLSYGKNVLAALMTAFSTASSSATLPITMECTTVKNGVSPRTSSFVLPLGATVNMDGTGLYEAVAAIFIAQVYGIDLSATQMVIVFLTATLAAIGAASIPEAGLVTMVIVLQAVNLPIEGISLILVIDWLLDRCRTTVNVWGDTVGAAVIDRFEGNR